MTKLINATAGSFVIYEAHPEWGDGLVRRIEPNGLLRVDFEIDGEPYTDEFHPGELRTSHKARPLAKPAA